MCWEHPPLSGKFAEPGHGLASLAECGYTVAGFVDPSQLPECERLGLRAIVGRPGSAVKWSSMSDAAIDAYVRDRVARSHDSPAVVGYFITDEPNARDFPALAKAVEEVKRYAPGKLAYINLLPDYGTLGSPDGSQLGTASYAEYLDRYIAEVKPQLLSYDNYRVLASNDLKKPAAAASYFTNLLAVRERALKHGLPFWNIVSSNQIRPHTPVPSPANLLFQAYTSLAAGANGVTWYKYYSSSYRYGPIDLQGNRTATWSYLKMVNDQLKVIGPMMLNLRSTGVYFTAAPAPVKDVPQLPGKLVESVESAAPIMVGEFAGADDQSWIMFVNLSLQDSTKMHVKWAGDAGTAAQLVSPVDGSLGPVEDDTIWLPAGQGVLVRRG